MFRSLDDDLLRPLCLTILRTAILEIAQQLCENVLSIFSLGALFKSEGCLGILTRQKRRLGSAPGNEDERTRRKMSVE
jgi:hypothetical protein